MRARGSRSRRRPAGGGRSAASSPERRAQGGARQSKQPSRQVFGLTFPFMDLAAVAAQDFGPERSALGKRGDRAVAIAAQGGEEGALRPHRLVGGPMVHRGEQSAKVA